MAAGDSTEGQTMSQIEKYTRQGTPRDPTAEEYRWVNGLLVNENGRSRNVLLGTDGMDEDGQIKRRNTWLFSAFTRRQSGLFAFWASEPSSLHSLHITEQATASRSGHANVSLDLADTSSDRVTLQIEAEACPVQPDEQEHVLMLFNAIRRIRDEKQIDLRPLSSCAEARLMFGARAVSATVQGPRLDDYGRHIQEGHLGVDLARLEGYDERRLVATCQ